MKKRKIKIILGLSVMVVIIAMVTLFIVYREKIISESYIGTYTLHSTDGYYLAKGTNDNDKMEYIFQTEPIDKSETLSDNVDITDEYVTIKNNYTNEEKESILKSINKSISKQSMDIFKNNLGKTNTVSVFAVSYKEAGKINTRYRYEILINQDKIKDFDNEEN